MSYFNFNQLPSSPHTSLSPLFRPPLCLDDYNPLKRRLTFNDFDSIVMPDGSRAFCLRQSSGVALWWTLNSVADDISTAAVSPICNDPVYPAAVRSYVPDMLFHRIGMKRPEVLKAIEIDSFNPLYLYTTIPNIVMLWNQLQQVGLDGVAWIRDAKERCALIGSGSGWNWDFHLSQIVDIPANQEAALQELPISNALGLHFDYSSTANRANTPTSVIQDSDITMDNSLLYTPDSSALHLSESREVVLHPFLSTYAFMNPSYDVFSRTPLVDNGYVDLDQMDVSDDSGSDFSWLGSNASTDSISTCNSVNELVGSGTIDYNTPFPIVIDDNSSQGSLTASDISGFIFPALRNDVVNA